MLIRILKGTGIALLSIGILIVGVYGYMYYQVQTRINQKYVVQAPVLNIRYDSAQLACGERLAIVKGCRDCHGDDMGGKVFVDDPGLGLLIGKNLTKGKGGLPNDYSTEDWVLALKHGIRRDGKTLLFMPSYEFTHLSEEDMSAIIAYAQSLQPVDRKLPDHNLKPLSYILASLDKLPLIVAEKIDHSTELIKQVKSEVSVDFGKYLSTSCTGCHRPNMKGGDPIAPGFPVVPDVTTSGNVGKWTEDQFITVLRSGKTPEGKEIDPKNMPWPMTAAYTDTELKALYAYLKSI
ncbi:MAG: c-type cytochrome [Cyclobacteriaceae bacterium]|nr:MAG: c-type cytochrome [Cyclobacteriaceae bacterium]